jgi:Uma2 family endonuclease
MRKEDAIMSASLKMPTPPARMTVAEFLQWPEDPTGALWQLVDGEPTMMAPASDGHNTVLGNLTILLGNHVQRTRPSCRVVPNTGIRPRVRRDHNVRIPDLTVTCAPMRHGVHLTPNPILTVEILSISNQAETWSNVWTYCTIPSLEEILVVKSTEYAAELLRRDADGSWPERFVPVGETFDLASIGGSFRLADVYRNVPPFDLT